MAQQSVVKGSTPLLSPDPLHPSTEQQIEGRDYGTISTSPSWNTVTQSSVEAAPISSFASSRSNILMEHDHEDENTPVLLSASQHSTLEQRHQRHEAGFRTAIMPLCVENAIMPPFFFGPTRSGIEQPHEHNQSSLSISGESSPNIQYSIGHSFASNTFAQQIQIQQHRPFSLSDPTQSSIMLRRNAHAGSASASRSSTSQQNLQNVDPTRVKQLISTLGFDDQLSEMFYKLVIATAPFHNTGSIPTPPVVDESNSNAVALREAISNLEFAPKSAEDPESRPLETRSESPPLLWSTAAAEDSLNPDAEDPRHYTVAEFVNTIIENRIQVESVVDQDWWTEEVRVAILNRLKRDVSEEGLTAEQGSRDLAVKKENEIEKVKAQKASEGGVTEKAKSKEFTSKADLQKWKEQGPEGWLKRDDGAEMNEEEIDEECVRWDAMVRKARNEEAEKASPSLGKPPELNDKGFWDFVRSSKS